MESNSKITLHTPKWIISTSKIIIYLLFRVESIRLPMLPGWGSAHIAEAEGLKYGFRVFDKTFGWEGTKDWITLLCKARSKIAYWDFMMLAKSICLGMLVIYSICVNKKDTYRTSTQRKKDTPLSECFVIHVGSLSSSWSPKVTKNEKIPNTNLDRPMCGSWKNRRTEKKNTRFSYFPKNAYIFYCNKLL